MALPPSSHSSHSTTRRTTKRVEWTPQTSVTVDLIRPGRGTLPACWADLSVTGVMLIVPSDAGVSFEPGGRIELDFTIDGIQIRLAGTVVWSRLNDSATITKAGVQFDGLDEEGVGALHPQLWEFFNRRESYRAGCEDDEAPDLTLHFPAGECTGRLLNISTVGMSLIFDETVALSSSLDHQLGNEFMIEMKLCAELPEIALCARAERLEAEGRYAVMAFSFPDANAEQSAQALEVIAAFVARQGQNRGDTSS